MIYNKNVEKTPQEIEELRKRHKQAAADKLRRKEQQAANLEQRQEKEAKKSRRGRKKPSHDDDSENEDNEESESDQSEGAGSEFDDVEGPTTSVMADHEAGQDDDADWYVHIYHRNISIHPFTLETCTTTRYLISFFF